MRCIRQAALTAVITIGLAASAAAQGNVTQADIQRLQDNVYQAGTDVSAAAQPRRRARQSAPDRARRPSRRSDLSQGEAAEGTVRSAAASTPMFAIASRISAPVLAATRPERVHAAARASRRLAAPQAPRSTSRRSGQPRRPPARRRFRSGPNWTCGLRTRLNSGTAQVEDRFEATTLVDFNQTAANAHARRVGDAWRGHRRRARDPHEPHGANDA